LANYALLDAWQNRAHRDIVGTREKWFISFFRKLTPYPAPHDVQLTDRQSRCKPEKELFFIIDKRTECIH
jgi:hypothetical protein